MATWASVLVWGILGISARFGLDQWLPSRGPASFPVSTFLINAIGSFLIGVLFVLTMERSGISPVLRTGVFVGFLGGFTTFSSYSLQTMMMVEAGQFLRAGLYFVASPITGVVCAFAGALVARALHY